MNKKAELFKNTSILGLGRISIQIISFLLIPLYTFFLPPSEYGTVDIIITYIALLVPFVTIQLDRAAFRFLIENRDNEENKKQVISNTIQIILLILLICIVIYFFVGFFIFIPYFALIPITIIATIFSNLFLQFSRGFGNNKQYAVASIITGLITLITSIYFVAIAHMGATGMLLSIAIAHLSCAIYLFFKLRIYKLFSFNSKDKNIQKALLKYSLPLVPSGMAWWVINVSDRTIITVFIGLAANGIYAIANKYAAIFTAIFYIFDMSWTESASVHINSKDRDSYFSDVHNASLKLFGSLGLIMISTLPIIFNLLINNKYNEAYMYVPILIVAMFFNAIVALYSAIYIAKKLTNKVFATSIMAAIINLVINITLIPFLGIYAAAISTAIAFIVMAMSRHHDTKKYVSIIYEKGLLIKLAILYLFAIILYYLNNPIGNIANLLIIVSAAVILNRSFLKIIKNKIKTKTA